MADADNEVVEAVEAVEAGEGVEGGALLGRELPSMINSAKLLAEHAAINGSKVRTRFPPEPNGYLHVGHAKSMNMNFSLAFEKLGVKECDRETVFRLDDTNPEAESHEYIESIRQDVEWLGWKPCKTTHTSDYFPQLYELAVELIRRDKAYVCHQSKADIEASREICKIICGDPTSTLNPHSPWRDRPVQESLREFENMRRGKYGSSDATLRMKMDMHSPNPNMWDQVAYRIKYIAHPMTDAWCIYPTYDYTHCIIDSLEHIDYSICTLEFETRRESYFWVLEALDLYRPRVYEMSRLNLSYTALSKRKLKKLVDSGFMRGWDDPRMPTITGLRRRGYTAPILNTFAGDIGATRNANVVQVQRLDAFARTALQESSPRVMAVLDPIRVEISGAGSEVRILDIPDFPKDLGRGSHSLVSESSVYISRSDFRAEDSEDYFGLAPGKSVGLKYLFNVKCDSFETADGDAGEVTLIRCSVVPDSEKPKGAIHWVPVSTAVPIEARIYSPLFTVEEPTDAWEAELNPTSEVVYKAVADHSLLDRELRHEMHFQFERVGYFVLDKDSILPPSTPSAGSAPGAEGAGRLIFNMTVSLKDSKPKAPVTSGASKSRKEEQAKALADKMAKMSICPEEFFKTQTDLYSAWDDKGVPTHDKGGEKISKSGYKKLQKDWEKQRKLFESAKA